MRSMSLRLTVPFAATGLLAADPVIGAEARLQIELPGTSPPPYMAAWVEKASDQSFIGNLAVLYDSAKRGNRGRRWLPDLRQWWRKSGGVTSLDADAVTGATRAPGTHTINLSSSRVLSQLPTGGYDMVVEVVREHGGYDLLRIPFSWPATKETRVTARGREEVGGVALSLAP